MSDLESKPTKVGKSEKANSRKATQLTDEAHNQLEKQSRRLGIKNQEYASAAISYFAESGLDPRKTSKASLAKIENSIVNETFDVRQHNADIGNRLVKVIRAFERNMGTLIQQQQAGTFKYLEGIERNILSYLVGIEENLLNTILERVVSNGVESYMNRILLQVLSLKFPNDKFAFSEKEMTELTASYDGQRNRQIVVESRQLLESKKVTRPKASMAPTIVELPKSSTAAKPATGATAPAGTAH